MTRIHYGLLRIAQRHPRLFAAMRHITGEPVHMAGAGRKSLPPSLAHPERNTASGEGSLRGLTDDDLARVVRGEPYTWACVPWRTDTQQRRRRDEPRASRWGDLT